MSQFADSCAHGDQMIKNFSMLIGDAIVIGNIIIMDKTCWYDYRQAYVNKFCSTNIAIVLLILLACRIWISSSGDESFGSLQCVMPSKYEALPLVSTLITPSSNAAATLDENSNEQGISLVSTRLAQKLAKKLNIQVFMTWNLVEIDDIKPLEAKLFEILSPHFLNASSHSNSAQKIVS